MDGDDVVVGVTSDIVGDMHAVVFTIVCWSLAPFRRCSLTDAANTQMPACIVYTPTGS